MTLGHESSVTCKLSEVGDKVHELADTFLRLEKLHRDDYIILTMSHSTKRTEDADVQG